MSATVYLTNGSSNVYFDNPTVERVFNKDLVLIKLPFEDQFGFDLGFNETSFNISGIFRDGRGSNSNYDKLYSFGMSDTPLTLYIGSESHLVLLANATTTQRSGQGDIIEVRIKLQKVQQ